MPPTVGRIFDITKDFWEKADTELGKTFFYSPANNTVFLSCNKIVKFKLK